MSADKTGKSSPQVVEKEFKIVNRLGVHARPASMLAKLTSSFESEIYINRDFDEINGKSIMGILMLAASHGSVLKFRAIGPDALEAIDAIGELINSKFGEE